MLSLTIEKLVYYAKKHLSLKEEDALYVKNIILEKLSIDSPSEEKYNQEEIDCLKVPDVLINELISQLKGYENPEMIATQIMGLLSPLPSVIIEKVYSLEKEESGKGLDYLFELQIKNFYIQKTAIDKNIYFKKNFADNFLEITINLSKPEKNNKDVAKLLDKSINIKDKYPKCLLCKENLGYGGRKDHPCRTNIRTIPFLLNKEKWFLQYSPYAYFDHHAIIINENHHNMVINEDTFKKLIDFVDLFPTFFIGSNADLPIVGGSILNHEHYQGGLHLLPMFYSQERKIIFDGEIKVSILNWYNSVVKIEGKDKNRVLEIADKILLKWLDYNNTELSIISYTDTRHSTITPLVRKVNDVYKMFLILRNNRTDDAHPEGIFHAHREYHAIKQESIGLIEATGLFILPPRLKRQMGYVQELLTNNIDRNIYFEKYDDLKIHQEMIEKLIGEYGQKNTLEQAHNIVNDYIAEVCKNILINTAVFKDDEKGNYYFEKFIRSALQ